jgi:hypothetical protein
VTPDAMRGMYLRSMNMLGNTVTIRRGSVSYSVRAWVTDNYEPLAVAGGVVQAKRVAIILADDIAAASFPLPFLNRQDRVSWGSSPVKTNVVVNVTTRGIMSVTVAYVLELDGA